MNAHRISHRSLLLVVSLAMAVGAAFSAPLPAAARPLQAPNAICTAMTHGMYWSTGTWSCGHVPVAGDSVVIGNGYTIGLDVSTPLLGNLTINASSILAPTDGPRTIGLTGNWTNNGMIVPYNGGSIWANFSGTGTQTISGSTLFHQLEISSGSVVTLAANQTAEILLIDAGGELDLGSFTLTHAGDPLGFLWNYGTLKIGGTNTMPSGYNSYTIGPTSTTSYDGTTQTVTPETYGHLSLSGGTKTLGGATTVAGNLTLSSGATLDVSASNYALNLAGNFTRSGTFTPRSGTVKFNGSAAQVLTGATTFYNLTIANTATTPSDSADVQSSAAVTVNNLLTVSDGQFYPFTGSSFNDVTISSSGIFKPATSASISVSDDWNRTGTFTHNSGTVTFNGSAAQALNNTNTFN